MLSPRSPVPITLKFNQTSLQTILDTLAKLAGVNVLYDQDYRDKKADVNLTGVTFQEALDRITFVNRLFYKVLDQNTLIVVPETPAKRRTYDEQVLRTFYLQNADATETLNLVKTLSGITKALANKDLQSDQRARHPRQGGPGRAGGPGQRQGQGRGDDRDRRSST